MNSKKKEKFLLEKSLCFGKNPKVLQKMKIIQCLYKDILQTVNLLIYYAQITKV